MNSAGNWMRPPPPTTESTNPARNAKRHSGMNSKMAAFYCANMSSMTVTSFTENASLPRHHLKVPCRRRSEGSAVYLKDDATVLDREYGTTG